MWLDIYNALGRDRRIFLSRYLDESACNTLITSLIWLDSVEEKKITIYLNAPGAMIRPTLSVFDVMNRLRSPIETINMGLTSGAACLIAAAGTKGMRSSTANARFLVGKAGLDDGIRGQSSDVALQVKEVGRFAPFGDSLLTLYFSR